MNHNNNYEVKEMKTEPTENHEIPEIVENPPMIKADPYSPYCSPSSRYSPNQNGIGYGTYPYPVPTFPPSYPASMNDWNVTTSWNQVKFRTYKICLILV